MSDAALRTINNEEHIMEMALKSAARTFLSARAEEQMQAVQRAALQIIAGIDFDRLMSASTEEKETAKSKLCRLIERERLKGLNGHWSYDLNRHIAFKQALNRLEGKKPTRVTGYANLRVKN